MSIRQNVIYRIGITALSLSVLAACADGRGGRGFKSFSSGKEYRLSIEQERLKRLEAEKKAAEGCKDSDAKGQGLGSPADTHNVDSGTPAPGDSAGSQNITEPSEVVKELPQSVGELNISKDFDDSAGSTPKVNVKASEIVKALDVEVKETLVLTLDALLKVDGELLSVHVQDGSIKKKSADADAVEYLSVSLKDVRGEDKLSSDKVKVTANCQDEACDVVRVDLFVAVEGGFVRPAFEMRRNIDGACKGTFILSGANFSKDGQRPNTFAYGMCLIAQNDDTKACESQRNEGLSACELPASEVEQQGGGGQSTINKEDAQSGVSPTGSTAGDAERPKMNHLGTSSVKSSSATPAAPAQSVTAPAAPSAQSAPQSTGSGDAARRQIKQWPRIESNKVTGSSDAARRQVEPLRSTESSMTAERPKLSPHTAVKPMSQSTMTAERPKLQAESTAKMTAERSKLQAVSTANMTAERPKMRVESSKASVGSEAARRQVKYLPKVESTKVIGSGDANRRQVTK